MKGKAEEFPSVQVILRWHSYNFYYCCNMCHRPDCEDDTVKDKILNECMSLALRLFCCEEHLSTGQKSPLMQMYLPNECYCNNENVLYFM